MEKSLPRTKRLWVNKEVKGANNEESSTPIPSEDTLVIMEFTDAFPKDSTLVPPEVTPVITEFIDVFSENLPNKLPPMHDTQHVIESDSEESSTRWIKKHVKVKTLHTVA